MMKVKENLKENSLVLPPLYLLKACSPPPFLVLATQLVHKFFPPSRFNVDSISAVAEFQLLFLY